MKTGQRELRTAACRVVWIEPPKVRGSRFGTPRLISGHFTPKSLAPSLTYSLTSLDVPKVTMDVPSIAASNLRLARLLLRHSRSVFVRMTDGIENKLTAHYLASSGWRCSTTSVRPAIAEGVAVDQSKFLQ